MIDLELFLNNVRLMGDEVCFVSSEGEKNGKVIKKN